MSGLLDFRFLAALNHNTAGLLVVDLTFPGWTGPRPWSCVPAKPRTKINSRPGRDAAPGKDIPTSPGPSTCAGARNRGIKMLANFCTGPYAATLSTSQAGDSRTHGSATWSLSEGPAMDGVLCAASRKLSVTRRVPNLIRRNSLGTQQPSGKNGQPGIAGGPRRVSRLQCPRPCIERNAVPGDAEARALGST